MNALAAGERQFQIEGPKGALDATSLVPESPVARLVLAHGAGAGHRHASMQAIAEAFAAQGLATLRFNFPYMQAGQRRVDSKAVTLAAIAAAAQVAAQGEGPPLWLAGHSFGGRMCSHAVAEGLVACAGLVFCSFPLHGPRKPARSRADHLPGVGVPMLFLSGTRDDLADADLLTEVVTGLPRARLHWLDTANHSYVILKRTRTHPLSVFEEMAAEARAFIVETPR